MSSDPPLNIENKEKPKFKVIQTFLIGLGFMSCMFAWSMYNFYLPRILAGHKVAEEVLRVGIFQGNTSKLWTGVIMTLDNIAAILLQPYFGDLSDRLESKHGRRTPFLIIGIPVAALSMFIMPFAIRISSIFALLVGFIGLVIVFNLGMAMYRAPVVALMPDLTPSTHRSMANVIINVMGGVGSVIGMYLPIIVGGMESITSKVVNRTTFENQDYFAMDCGIFWSSAAIILIILVLYLIFVHEIPTGDKFWHLADKTIKFDPDTLEIIPNTDKTSLKEKYNIFKELNLIRNASDKSTLYMFLSLFFWTMCTDVFGTFLSLWGPEYALLSDSILGSMSIITAVVLLALGYPAALISKKKGRLWTMRLGTSFLVIAYGALIVFQELGRANFGTIALVGVIACIVLKTFGGSLIAISAITITWQLAPDNKIGTYTGLYYLFKQLGQVLSPILFGGIISIFTALLGETMAWITFIPYCLIFAVLFYWTFAKVKKGEVGDTWDPSEDIES
ncbi:MAG: MFS transporter [Promethearchaeota archaeon]